MKYLIYCTKAKPYLNLDYGFDDIEDYKGCWHMYLSNKKEYCTKCVNGTIVAECEVECEEIYGSNMITFEKASCVDRVSMFKYLNPLVVWDNSLKNLLQASEGRKMGYALHISNLKAFDEPLELNELKSQNAINPFKVTRVEKAPQNMCYVWYKGERYCLISIRPEWVCKILNGEKTIEVRKKVLKLCEL